MRIAEVTDRWWSRLTTLALALVLGVGMAGALGGCETTEGAGRDIESAGEGVQDIAN
ncbi:MAG: entericidin A/B family lipoprotein [Phycisphaeraceae bacterium]